MEPQPKPEAPTLRRILADARLRLAANDDAAAAPRLEAELLICHVLGVDRAHCFAHPEQIISDRDARAFRSLVRRRARGEPLAYITGVQEFWSLDLEVSPAVLIPRPETELLVKLALDRLTVQAPAGAGTARRVADIGTGSGAIALAIARERPDVEVHAVDISPDALEVARRNAERTGLSRVSFHEGSWCAPLTGRFEVIVSNPPYVHAEDEHLEVGDLRFEPRIALTPGKDDLVAFRSIAEEASARLVPGGWLLFEHGFEQGKRVRELLAAKGWVSIETRRDLAQRERVTLAQRPA